MRLWRDPVPYEAYQADVSGCGVQSRNEWACLENATGVATCGLLDLASSHAPHMVPQIVEFQTASQVACYPLERIALAACYVGIGVVWAWFPTETCLMLAWAPPCLRCRVCRTNEEANWRLASRGTWHARKPLFAQEKPELTSPPMDVVRHQTEDLHSAGSARRIACISHKKDSLSLSPLHTSRTRG